MTQRSFPIRLEKRIACIPWDMIEPHEPQAWANHKKSIMHLAAAGGLTPEEAIAILEDRPFELMGITAATLKLKGMVEAWLDPMVRLNDLPTVKEMYPNGTPKETYSSRKMQAEEGIGLLIRLRDGHTVPNRTHYNRLIAILEGLQP